MFLLRVKTFIHNIRWISEFTNNPIYSASFILLSRFIKGLICNGNYGGTDFSFRRSDLPALKEILVQCEYSFIEKQLKDTAEPNIVDIGAHIGLPIIWALSKNKKINVFSVEASPDTYKILAKNQSKASSIQWRILHAAAWKDKGPVRFQTIGTSMSHRASTSGEIEVIGVTLQEILNLSFSDQIIDIMKIDIEGAEEAFLGTNPEMLRNVKSLVIELHPQLCNTEKVVTLLNSAFSHIEYITNRTSSRPLLYCKK